MRLPDAIARFREELLEKDRLIESRRAYEESSIRAREFFAQQAKNPNPTALKNGANHVLNELIAREEIDKRIFDLDSSMLARLEAFFSDCLIEFDIPAHATSAGDAVGANHVRLHAFREGSTTTHDVTLDDLWILKVIKAAVGAKNVQIIPRSTEE